MGRIYKLKTSLATTQIFYDFMRSIPLHVEFKSIQDPSKCQDDPYRQEFSVPQAQLVLIQGIKWYLNLLLPICYIKKLSKIDL